ncbi:putative B-cell receptor-associated protein [Dioscorea sansibarensis]
MIQLLFMLLFAEGAVALVLMVKIGMLTELALNALDQLKIGKGPATVKTLACTMSAILLSSIISIFKMQNKSIKVGNVTPVDQVLRRTHILEASLVGMFDVLLVIYLFYSVHCIQKEIQVFNICFS